MNAWVYTRKLLHAPRTRQRVRLGAVVTGPITSCGWNLIQSDSSYHSVYCKQGDVYQRTYSGSVPRQASPTNREFEARVTVTGDCSEPRIAYDTRGTLFCLYTRTASANNDVWQANSWDDGRTWRDFAVAFTGGKHPTISVGTDGAVVRAAYVSGKIAATRQDPGVVYASAESFNLKDNTGTDLSVADDSFHLVPGLRADAPWLLIVTIFGETAPSDWISGDDCRQWTRLT
jgi:hypothetical protein